MLPHSKCSIRVLLLSISSERKLSLKDETPIEAECSRHWSKHINRTVCRFQDSHFRLFLSHLPLFQHGLKGQLLIAGRGAITIECSIGCPWGLFSFLGHMKMTKSLGMGYVQDIKVLTS